jgi:CheY-like chemotaxis protein
LAGSPIKLALVEDSKSDARLIMEMLDDTGLEYNVAWLSDGEQALHYFEANASVDFILLDLNIPKINGHQLMGLLKERGVLRATPVIVMTGSNSPDDMMKAKENGVVCYLIKPMTVEEMDRMAVTLKEIFLYERSCDCDGSNISH